MFWVLSHYGKENVSELWAVCLKHVWNVGCIVSISMYERIFRSWGQNYQGHHFKFQVSKRQFLWKMDPIFIFVNFENYLKSRHFDQFNSVLESICFFTEQIWVTMVIYLIFSYCSMYLLFLLKFRRVTKNMEMKPKILFCWFLKTHYKNRHLLNLFLWFRINLFLYGNQSSF